MRTAPSFRLDVPTSRGWRRAQHGAWLTTGAVLAGWLLTAWAQLDLGATQRIAASLAAAAWLLVRPMATSLRIGLAWDGLGWRYDPHPPAHREPVACAVGVAIDLDAWLLLRLHPLAAGPRWRRRVHWVALSRSDVGPHWHGLRCALYSARRMIDPAPSLPTPPPIQDRPPPR